MHRSAAERGRDGSALLRFCASALLRFCASALLRFCVSRPIVREALSELQHAGVIQVRQGAGSFVRSASAINQSRSKSTQPTFGPVQSLMDVRQCFEFRASPEGEAAALAAEHNTPQLLLNVEKALLWIEQAISGKRANVEAGSQFEADF